MSLWHAVILAVIQGFTEFLPISSTAHLILFPWLLGWPKSGLAFDVALHAGTLMAVVIYFFREWVKLIACGLGGRYPANAPAEEVSQHRRFFWYMVVGTIPGGLLGLLFQDRIEDQLSVPKVIGFAMVAVALLMWWADTRSALTRRIEQSNLGDAIGIGTAQALALIPGVSRSGVTITTGLFRGLTRDAATRFSFILSTPLITGAVLLELPKLLRLHRAAGLDLPLSTLLVSILVSGIVGVAVIAFFLRYLRTRTLKFFVVYRLLFGIVILILAFLHWGSAR